MDNGTNPPLLRSPLGPNHPDRNAPHPPRPLPLQRHPTTQHCPHGPAPSRDPRPPRRAEQRARQLDGDPAGDVEAEGVEREDGREYVQYDGDAARAAAGDVGHVLWREGPLRFGSGGVEVEWVGVASGFECRGPDGDIACGRDGGDEYTVNGVSFWQFFCVREFIFFLNAVGIEGHGS